MTTGQLRDTYSGRISFFRSRIRFHNRWMNYISASRLLSLALLVWFIVLGLRSHLLVDYLCSGAMFVLFLLLVGRYNRQKDLRNLNSRLEELNRLEISCMDHDYHFRPDGRRFADPSHSWSHDLDLFGKGSLFQFVNRTTILQGGDCLAGFLTAEPGGTEHIRERQGIIGDLRDRIDFRQTFTARGSMIREKDEDLPGITAWLSAKAFIVRQKWLFPLALGISVTALGIIIAGFFNPMNFRYLLLLLLLNFTILSPFLVRTNRYQQTISRKHELLDGYARLLGLICSTPFSHDTLKGHQQKAREGMKEVATLSGLINIFDQRLNMLLGIVFNGLFLFDFIMLHLLERWKEKNREKIMEWIGITGWTDAMISLAGFAYNHPGFAVPEIREENGTLEAEGIGHPLIPPSRRVVNRLSLGQERVIIITGANMAGKSTFLRSLGINTVLAYAGCPVCADRFSMGYTGLCSSMRTADSLADEESYFLAEIRKLQRIVQRMEQGEPLLILLDEVLKGTNTTDKKLGSVGLIERCLGHRVRCFIATHDLSLGEMEQVHQGKVVNYCFESYIRDLELEFDYTLRKGIAKNMNASFLMKKMGIMD
jgi:hypothetical protein